MKRVPFVLLVAAAVTVVGSAVPAASAPKMPVKAPLVLGRIACDLGAIAEDWDFALGPHGFHTVDCDNGGSGPLWEYGVTTYVPGAPGAVWATTLNADYPNSRGQGLRSPQFLVTAQACRVEILHYFQIETGYDGGNVRVWPAGGVWIPLGGYSTTAISPRPDDYAYCVDGEPGWTGESDGWRSDCFDLTEFLGQEVRLEFDFGSDASVTGQGWYLARVRVGAPASLIGACCELATGACEILPEGPCSEQQRIWHPEWISCDPNPCSQPCPLVTIDRDWNFREGDQGFQVVACGDTTPPVWEYGFSDKAPGPAMPLWGTRLQGIYPDLSGEALRSPDFDVTEAARRVEVWHFFEMETPYDGGNVVIGGAGIADQLVVPIAGYSLPVISPGTSYAPCVDEQPGWSGASGNWRVDCFDLGPWIGHTVHLDFRFGSDLSIGAAGWCLQRVRVGAPPGLPFPPALQAIGCFNPEPWNNWIGPTLEEPGQLSVDLRFRFPDPAGEIEFVDFYWDSLGTWAFLGEDDDGVDPWFDTYGTATPVGDGWSLRAVLPIPLPDPADPVTFRAVAHLPGRAELSMQTSVPVDPTPPANARGSLQNWQTIDADTLGMTIAPNGTPIDSVVVYLRHVPPIYEKGVPGISQQGHSPTHCAPTATAQCLKYFELVTGDDEITGGLDDFALVEGLARYMATNGDIRPGTYLSYWIGGLEGWIEDHGAAYTVRAYRHFDDSGWIFTEEDWLRLRDELERSQDVLVGVFWRSGDTYLGGHALTLNGIANAAQPDGRYLLDFMDPWTGAPTYGLLNPASGEIVLTDGAAGSGAVAQVGATIVVCPQEARPGFVPGAYLAYSGPNPWPNRLVIELPEVGGWFVDVVVVNDRGHAHRRTSVVVYDPNSDVGPESPSAPLEFALGLARPNPFRQETELSYTLPARDRLRIEVYDVTGRRLRTLADRRESAGVHRIVWDGRDGEGRPVGTGVYFVRMIGAGGVRQTRVTLLH